MAERVGRPCAGSLNQIPRHPDFHTVSWSTFEWYVDPLLSRGGPLPVPWTLDVHVHVTFGDIWCRVVSFDPAPHIYQRGERVGEPVCTIHGHYPE